MSDIAELIERLRQCAQQNRLDTRALGQAADALEAQAKEIADLQQRNVERAREIDKLRLVISKLKATKS